MSLMRLIFISVNGAFPIGHEYLSSYPIEKDYAMIPATGLQRFFVDINYAGYKVRGKLCNEFNTRLYLNELH